MNFIQKNPNDPKYGEFHDGEYEYWPVDDFVKPKSISIPAALVSGLELLAAVAAAGLLAAALAVLYVISAPLAISENGATINTNVYNNRDNQPIVYTLSTEVHPDRILLDGKLEDNEETLFLQNLNGGTTYLLKYYNSEQEEIGHFRFTTPGEQQGEEVPEVSVPITEPTVPESPTSEPNESTVPTSETEPSTEPEPETTESTEAPIVPEYRPPVVIPPAAKPGPEPTTEPTEPETEPAVPETEPTDPETEPTVPETEPTEPPTIIVADPDIGEITYVAPEISGDEIEAYFQCEQIHTFRDVPAGDITIEIVQDDTPITEYSYEHSEDGMLSIRFTGGLIPVGHSSTTTVTVTSGSESASSTYTLLPPSLESTEISVEKNDDNSYTFTVTANVLSDGTQELVCEALLYTNYDDHTGVTLDMTPESSERYTASHTCFIETSYDEEEAFVIVTGYWAMVGDGEYSQTRMSTYYYTP